MLEYKYLSEPKFQNNPATYCVSIEIMPSNKQGCSRNNSDSLLGWVGVCLVRYHDLGDPSSFSCLGGLASIGGAGVARENSAIQRAWGKDFSLEMLSGSLITITMGATVEFTELENNIRCKEKRSEETCESG